VVAMGTCCSSTLSNPTTEGTSERPGEMDSCLISSISRGAIPKAHRYPFGSLKYPLPRQSIPRMHGASGPVTMGCFWHSCPVRLQPPVHSALGTPLSLPKCKWTLTLWNLMALKYTVHQCPLELYTLVDLTCQATEFTLSNKRGCPFPPWLETGPL